MSEAKHFHPLAFFLLFFSQVKTWWFIFLPLLPRLVAGEKWTWWLILGLFALAGGHAFLSYWFSRYQLTTTHLDIMQGIFIKKRRTIPYERIQSVHQRQWFFLKPFDLVHLKVDTASGGAAEAEANLLAVPTSVFQQLEAYRVHDVPSSQTVATPDEPGYAVTQREIFLFAATDLGLIPLFFAALSLLDQLIPSDWLEKASTEGQLLFRSGWIVASALAFLILLCLVFVSFAKQFILFYQFQVTRTSQELHIERGLFERRTTIVPIAKIQQVQLKQQLFRQVLGLTTVQIILAGEQEKEDSVLGKIYLLPIISQKIVYKKLADLLPELQLAEPDLHYVTAKNHHLLWYFWRWPLACFVPVSLLVAYFFHWFALIPIAFLLFFLVAGLYKREVQAYVYHDKHLVIQTAHFLTKELSFVAHRRVQNFETTTSRWLYPKHLGHVALASLAGSYSEQLHLRFIAQRDIDKLYAFYGQHSQRHDITVHSQLDD